MLQLIKAKKEISLKEVPSPLCGDNEVLIKTKYSTILNNVEKNVFQSKKGNMLSKVIKQRSLLNFAIKKVKTDGLKKTYEFSKAMKASWHTVGASCVGVVIKVGKDVKEIKEGDKVLATGWYAANHANFNVVKEDLVVKLPEEINEKYASLIAYAAKILKILKNIDTDNKTLGLYQKNCGTLLLAEILKTKDIPYTFLSEQGNVDILLCVHQDIEDSEITFKEKIFISENNKYRCFLPDRQLHRGEEDVSLVEKLNLEDIQEVNKLLENIDFSELIQKEINFKDIAKEFPLNNTIATVVSYNQDQEYKQTIKISNKEKPKEKIGIAIIGAGNMAKNIHIPTFLDNENTFIKYILTKSGRSAAGVAEHYQVPYATSSYEDILKDEEVNTIVILSHHSSHADYMLKAMQANKNIFVEKPFAISKEQCTALEEMYKEHPVTLTVGFNKTFSPLAQEARAFFKDRKNPLMITYRLQVPINKGKAWYYNPKVGGGRLVGEYCHLFDFAHFITGSKVKDIKVSPLEGKDPYFLKESNLIVLLTFEDGSVASLICSEDGNTNTPKERIEIIADNNAVIIEDWETITINGKKENKGIQKGYKEHWDNFISTVKGSKKELIDIERALNVTRSCLEAAEKI